MVAPNAILFILLLLAVSPVVSTNATELPPALPESEWTSKSALNYTSLHDTLGQSLLCLDIPVGVFGFYLYTAQHLMIYLSMFLMIRERNSGRTAFLGSYVMCVFSLLLVVQQCKTLHSCSAYWHDVGRWTIPGLVVSCLTQLASILSLLGTMNQTKEEYWNAPRVLAMVCYSVAMNMNFIPGFIYPAAVMGAANIKYIRWLDGVELNYTLAAAVPIPALVLILVFCWCSPMGGGKWHFDSFAFAGLVFVSILCWTGAAYVFMGKIIGSPSGVYWLKRQFGRVDVAWMTVFPLVQSSLAIMSA